MCNLRRNYVSLFIALTTAALPFSSAFGETVTRVIGWGDNAEGQLAIPVNLSGLTAVSAGESHALALKEDGTVVGWGDNLSGQATPPKGLKNVEAIAAGGFHSLALKRDGTVVAWGRNDRGQCNVPAKLTTVKAVAAGYNHSLALKYDGTVVAWGDNLFGQCGVPTDLIDVGAVYASGDWSGALKSTGFLANWGNINDEPLVPPDFAMGDRVASNSEHGITLKANGLLSGFGKNSKCQTNIPDGVRKAIAVAVGKGFSLAIIQLEKQEIDFKPIGGIIFKKTPIPLIAESSAKLPIKFQSLNPAIADISDGKLVLHQSGVLSICANQEGNNQYGPAKAIQMVKIFPAPRKMVEFKPIGNIELGMNPNGIPLQAVASAGDDEIIYSSSNPKVARIDGNRLYILSVGVARISALARQTPQYGYAQPITQTIEVNNPSTEQLITTLFGNRSLAGHANYQVRGHDPSEIDYAFAIAFNGDVFGKGVLVDNLKIQEPDNQSDKTLSNTLNIRISGTVRGPVMFSVDANGAFDTAKAFISIRLAKGLFSNGIISLNAGSISAEGPVKTILSGFSSIGKTSAHVISKPIFTYSGLNPTQQTQDQIQSK